MTFCGLPYTFSVKNLLDAGRRIIGLVNLPPLALCLYLLLATYAVPGLRAFGLLFDLLSCLVSFQEGDETSKLVIENFWRLLGFANEENI